MPLAALGLAVQVPTGLVLLSVEATKLGVNPAFYAKLAFIAVGLANLAVLHGRSGSAMKGDDLPAGAGAPGDQVLAFLQQGALDHVLPVLLHGIVARPRAHEARGLLR